MVPGEGTNQVKPSPKAYGVRSHLSTSLVSNDKTKTVKSQTSLRQGRTILGLGDYSASEAIQHFPQGILCKSGFYKMLEEAMQKQSMIGQEVDFLVRLAGPIFQGQVNQVKWHWRTGIGVDYGKHLSKKPKCRLIQVYFCDLGWATGAASIVWVLIQELTFSLASEV